MLDSAISTYTVDQVSIVNMAVRSKKPSKKGLTVVEFTGRIHVPESHDRRADVTLVINKGDAVVAKGAAMNIKAEEGGDKSFTIRLTFAEDHLASLWASEPGLTMQTGLAVRLD